MILLGQGYIYSDIHKTYAYYFPTTNFKVYFRKADEAQRLKTNVDTKYILNWCEAYGGLNYMWEFGSEKFR